MEITPVAAQTDSNPIDDLFNDSDTDSSQPSFFGELVDFATNPGNWGAAFDGVRERVSYQASRSVPWADPPDTDLDAGLTSPITRR